MGGKMSPRGSSCGSKWSASLVLAALCIWAMTSAAFAAEKIRVRAWAHSEFGRIVFDWPSDVQHSAKIANEKLIIRFNKKFTADLKPIAQKLQRYIFNISVGADGKSIVADLTAPFRMRSFVNEGAIVVDIADQPRGGSYGAAVTPKPVVKIAKKSVEPKAEPTVAALPETPAPPALKVRTGEHQGYDRLVFDWTSAVEYQVGREDGKFDIRFNRSASIDMKKLRKDMGNRVAAIETANGEHGLNVGFRLKEGVRVRHFRDGTRVVVDVLAAAPSKAKKSEQAHASGRPVSLTKLASRKKAKTRAKRRAERRARNREIKFGPQAALVTVKVVRRSSDKLNVRFNWRRAVSAAFYRRHGNIWAYFDKASRIDLGGLKTLGDGIVEEVQQYPLPKGKGALVRITVSDRFVASVNNRGSKWLLEIGPRRFKKLKHSIEVKVHTGERPGPRVVASLPNPGPVVMLRDPEIGDVIGVVPIKHAGYGVDKSRRFIDFTLFSSAAGLAYHPMNEGLQVSAAKSGVVIAAPRGLMISGSDDIARGRANAEVDTGRLLWNIEAWRRASSDDTETMRKKLIRRVIQARASQRNAARINLAKFYLSHGGAADALGIVSVVLRQKPNREQQLALRSIQAAGNYFLRHYGEADKLLDDPNLKAEQGAIPWLAALSAAKGDWRDAQEKFLLAGKVTELYPVWMQRHFLLLAAEAALVSGKADTAKVYLKSLNNLAPLPDQLADIKYLRGFLLKQTGKLDEAKRLWSTLVKSENRPARAKAIVAIIEADLEKKTIGGPEAIKRLEELSFAWRGDVFEYDLLRRIGELHIAEDSYRKGFTRLRQAASYFKKVEGAEGITQLMNSHFKKLYLGGVADKLPPVTALALFEEFRELAPAGSEGDEMIRKLADRLAKVDLLDEAAKLLDHQVEFRLDGAEKARIGVRAAIIRLLDNKPEMALAALADSDVSDMPVKLERQRRFLKSNILGKLGKVDEALALFTDDYSPEAEKTRAGVTWRNSKWRKASAILQRIMSKRKLSADDSEGARFVVQWVIARAMLGDNRGIEILRDRFGDVMAKTDQAKPFKVLVGNNLDGIDDYPALVKAASDIDRLQAFMGEYRNVVRDEQLSAIN
jgi:hypothetical protein